jgi:N-acetylneuraminic acid mutarotase
MRGVWIVVLVAACGYPRPPRFHNDAGGDGPADSTDAPTGPCTDCTLTAVHPAVAAVGATITLEGTFADSVDVTFPGGTHVAATVLGPSRATVVVPAGATAGMLTATSGGGAGSLPFRATTFAPGLGHYLPYEQLDIARQSPSLAQARRGACAVSTGVSVYVFGGEDASSNALGSIERALINADGTLLSFVPAGNLNTARRFATCIATGGYIYAIGGSGANGMPLTTVEAAPFMADGTLGPFAAVTTTLIDGRQHATSEIIGDYVYVIGGDDVNGDTGSVERAPIHPDGTLGAFETATATLKTPRTQHTTNVVGNTLYVLGGLNSGNLIASIESAPIAADGSLGAFTTSTLTLPVPRAMHGSIVLGDHLYVMGGAIQGGSDQVDAAPIDATGLGAFATVDTWYLTTQLPNWDGDPELAAYVVVGNYVYAIGGKTYRQAEKTVERASIIGTGSIGTSAVATQTVAVPTGFACSFVLANRVYLIGGESGQTETNAVQSAPIDVDGNVGNFTQSTTNHLVIARQQPACAIVGGYLYVLGGFNQNMTPRYLTSIERAPIMDDGTLGTFAMVTDNALAIPRGGHRAIVLNDGLYVLGGVGGPTEVIQNTEEVAFINPDNSLMPFQTMSATIPGNGRASFVLGNFGRWLYLIGGVTTGGTTGEIDYLVLTDNSGQIGGNFGVAPIQLATTREHSSAVLVGNNLFVVAGYSSNPFVQYQKNSETATVAAEGLIGAFPSPASGGELTSSRYAHASGVSGNHVWHLAGEAPGGQPNTIEQATLP